MDAEEIKSLNRKVWLNSFKIQLKDYFLVSYICYLLFCSTYLFLLRIHCGVSSSEEQGCSGTGMSGEEKKSKWEGGCWKLKYRVGEREEGQKEDGCRWWKRTQRKLGQWRGDMEDRARWSCLVRCNDPEEELLLWRRQRRRSWRRISFMTEFGNCSDVILVTNWTAKLRVFINMSMRLLYFVIEILT